MHAPDGFLTPTVAFATGALSAATVAYALRRLRPVPGEAGFAAPTDDRSLPLAGLLAAFIFAAQMINVPVAAGTTGHLMGGALAALLLGPWLAVVVMTTVVTTQALLFADGGITALGYNILNLAIVAPLGATAIMVAARRLLGSGPGRISLVAGLAAFGSVLLSAFALSLEWLFGATAPVPFDRFLIAVVAVHAVIGLGEAVVTGLLVGTVASSRPDLIPGLEPDGASSRNSNHAGLARPLLIGAAVTVAVGLGLSQFAADAPDGLERVMEDNNIVGGPGAGGLLADYAVAGVDNPTLSLAVAALLGLIVVAAVASGFVAASNRTRP